MRMEDIVFPLECATALLNGEVENALQVYNSYEN